MEESKKRGCGCFTWVAVIIVLLFVFTWKNASDVAKSVNGATEPTFKVLETKSRERETESTAATSPTVLPGSAAEAVQNGTLTMAEIAKRAEAIGWSTTAWQEWYYIANQTGTTMEAIEKAAEHINTQLEAGDQEFLAALAELGITEADAKAMKPDELFEKVIYGLQTIED